MDISKIGNLSQSPSPSPSPGRTQAQGSFREIYQGQLSSVPQTATLSLFEARTELMNQGDKVLDLLEAYATELSNPEKTLKEIDPLARAIEKEVNIFESKRAGNPDIDEELEGFADALEITANVALLKFQRGDFI